MCKTLLMKQAVMRIWPWFADPWRRGGSSSLALRRGVSPGHIRHPDAIMTWMTAGELVKEQDKKAQDHAWWVRTTPQGMLGGQGNLYPNGITVII